MVLFLLYLRRENSSSHPTSNRPAIENRNKHSWAESSETIARDSLLAAVFLTSCFPIYFMIFFFLIYKMAPSVIGSASSYLVKERL